jgi:hypothetical protein
MHKSYAWLFLPDELDALAESRQPVPGDVLLLDSRSVSGAAARIVQGFSRHSHIGIVIGADLYIDAVSSPGVSVRKVADLPDRSLKYRLDRCVVLRNSEVVARAPAIWTSALEHLDRPYKLHGVLTEQKGMLDDRDPLICSKLVATILSEIDVELPISPRKALPRNLDRMLSGPHWTRFAVGDYDVIKSPASVSSARLNQTQESLRLVPHAAGFNRSYRSIMRTLSGARHDA